jgi:hypothetical protein
MEFIIFERADSALLVVPALFQPPVACGRDGPLRVLGRCDVEIEDFSPRVAAELAAAGFAHVEGADWALLRPFLHDVPADIDRAAPEPRLPV